MRRSHEGWGVWGRGGGTHPDLAHSGHGVGPQLVHDRQQHLVTGDLAEVDPGGGGSCIKGRAWVGGVGRAERPLPEEEEEAAADQLHLQALLDVSVEELQQVGDVGEREDQQGDL